MCLLKKHALWSCTQGFVPIRLLHRHRRRVPLRAKPSATGSLPTLLYLLLRAAASAQREAVLPGSLLTCSRGSNRPYSFTGTLFTVGPGSPGPQDTTTVLTTEAGCVQLSVQRTLSFYDGQSEALVRRLVTLFHVAIENRFFRNSEELFGALTQQIINRSNVRSSS